VPATVTGDALKLVPVNRQATININLPDTADLNDLTVTVTGGYGEKSNINILVLICWCSFSVFHAVLNVTLENSIEHNQNW
jgi:hypothetical protein